MANINRNELKEMRKQWFAKMEQELRELQPNEEDKKRENLSAIETVCKAYEDGGE